MPKKNTAVTVQAQEDQDVMVRWARAETAFDLVRLQGRSIRQAAEELDVAPTTVWRDIRAYEAYLAAASSQRDVKEIRATVERLAMEALEGCRDIIRKNPNKPLTQVAAWNTFVSTLAHLRAVTGADVPRNRPPDKPGVVQISWSNSYEDD